MKNILLLGSALSTIGAILAAVQGASVFINGHNALYDRSSDSVIAINVAVMAIDVAGVWFIATIALLLFTLVLIAFYALILGLEVYNDSLYSAS